MAFFQLEMRWLGARCSRRWRLLAVLILLFAAPLGTANAASLTVAREFDADGLDPQRDGSTRAMQVASLIFDTLLTMDAGGTIRPGIAKSWTVSEDGLSYAFAIRDGVQCHDGSVLDAASVKASIDRALDPRTINPNAPAWGPIVATDIAGDVVTIRLGERFEPLVSFLTSPPSAVICPAAVAGEVFQPIGTGPFRLVNWVRNDRVELEANRNYRNVNPLVRNPGPPHVERLTLRVIPEAVARMAALRSGEVHMADPSIADAGSVNNPGIALYSADLTGEIMFAGFTWRVPPFDNPEIRRAIAMALNRQSYAEIAFAGLTRVADCPIAPGLFGNDPQHCAAWGAPYDPEGAKALLTKAGYGAEHPLRMRILGPAREGWTGTYQIMEQDLAAIGVKAEIQALEPTTFFHMLAAANASDKGEPTLWVSGVSGVDPNYLYFLWKRPGFVNMGIDAELDALLEAQRALAGAARAQKLDEIQKYLLQKGYMVPLLSPGWSWLMAHSTRVQGFRMGFMASLIFNDVEVAAP